MSRGTKKPRVRMKSINASKTQKLSGFFDYLTQRGHQTAENEVPEVYTNLDDATAYGIKQFMDQYEKNFRTAIKEKKLRHNSVLLAKSMVFALPNEMTSEEIDGYVKAITKALPDYMTFAFAVHRGSNKNTSESQKNLHLQGFLGVRGNGSEKFGPEVRLPLHENLVKASDEYIKKIGFKIKYNPTQAQPCAASLRCLESEAFKSALDEGLNGNRALKSRQAELLRDSGWLTNFSKREDIRDPKLKQFCAELAMKRIDINAERYQKHPGLDLEFVGRNLNKAIKAKVAAETKMEVVKLPLPHRLQPECEEKARRAKLLRQRQEEIAEQQALEKESEKQLRKLHEELERLRNTPTIQQKVKGRRL